MTSDTIAAIATPPGAGGIGVIKVSGPRARRIALELFRRRPDRSGPGSRVSGEALKSHRLYHGYIADPVGQSVVDEVLLAVMDGPRSYTGEDVAEIQAHSGSAILQKILALVLQQGARLAEPGEFTRRAFINGRVDLTEAEAVMDAIHADNEIAMQAAARQLHGELRQSMESIRWVLADLKAEFEAAIDFPEDMDDGLDGKRILSILQRKAVAPLRDLIDRQETMRVYRDGLRLVIVGRPNVGKSSLMNALLNQSRAIVTPVPGTTRDFVQESLVIQGIPAQLIDTAGLHDTDNAVERLGIEKTRQCARAADLVLLVVDASEPLTEEDERIYEFCRGKPTVLVANKIDRLTTEPASRPQIHWEVPAVYTSALEGSGIGTLRAAIFECAFGSLRPPQDHAVIPNLRHRKAMESALESIERIRTGLQGDAVVDLLSLDLQDALDGIDAVLGNNVDRDVLDRIFTRFCIGK